MIWFDILLVVCVVVFGAKGFFRGLVNEAVGLVGLVLGVSIASRNFDSLGGVLAGKFALNETTANFLGFFLLFLFVWAFCLLLGWVVSKFVSLSGLGLADKLVGAAFGVAKVVCIFGIVASIVAKFDIAKSYDDALSASSVSYSSVKSIGGALAKLDYNELLNQSKEIHSKAVNAIEDTTGRVLKEVR